MPHRCLQAVVVRTAVEIRFLQTNRLVAQNWGSERSVVDRVAHRRGGPVSSCWLAYLVSIGSRWDDLRPVQIVIVIRDVDYFVFYIAQFQHPTGRKFVLEAEAVFLHQGRVDSPREEWCV